MSIETDHRDEGAELTLWRRKNPSLEASSCEQGPFCTSAPALTEEIVLSRAFGPPGVSWLLAVRKSTGDVAWTRTLESSGRVRTTADCVYLSMGRPIICLDATTGQLIWQTTRELTQISDPTIALERAFFWSSNSPLFTRELQVSCVDATSGAFLWSTLRPHCIPHSLLVTDAKVLGSEHGSIFALDALDGHVVWERAVSAAVVRTIAVGCGGALVCFSDNRIELLSLDDGAARAEWAWPGKLIGDLAGAGDQAFVIRSVPTDAIVGDRDLTMPDESEIVQLHAGGSVGWAMETAPGHRMIRWDRESGYLLEALGDDLGLIDPAIGRRRHLISIGKDECWHRPRAEAGRAYLATTFGGEVICLRLPVQERRDNV